MDFSAREKVLTSTPVPRSEPSPRESEVASWFARGIALEEDPNTQPDAIAAYHQVLEIQPTHAAAHINLGTLYYNRQDFALAERHYRQAIEADPRYSLAYFDLGNVLDETGRVQEAIQTYKTALQLAPTYADAHYNLALAYEKIREPRKALKHWQAYVKLDTSGPWSVHARSQIKRILQADGLKLVSSAGQASGEELWPTNTAIKLLAWRFEIFRSFTSRITKPPLKISKRPFSSEGSSYVVTQDHSFVIGLLLVAILIFSILSSDTSG